MTTPDAELAEVCRAAFLAELGGTTTPSWKSLTARHQTAWLAAARQPSAEAMCQAFHAIYLFQGGLVATLLVPRVQLETLEPRFQRAWEAAAVARHAATVSPFRSFRLYRKGALELHGITRESEPEVLKFHAQRLGVPVEELRVELDPPTGEPDHIQFGALVGIDPSND